MMNGNLAASFDAWRQVAGCMGHGEKTRSCGLMSFSTPRPLRPVAQRKAHELQHNNTAAPLLPAGYSCATRDMEGIASATTEEDAQKQTEKAHERVHINSNSFTHQ